MTARHTRQLPVELRRTPASDVAAEALAGDDLGKLRVGLDNAVALLRQQNDAMIEIRGTAEAAQRRYSDLFDSAPEPCLVTDARGTLREANMAAREVLGLPLERIIGKPLVALVAFEDRRAVRSIIHDALKGGRLSDRTLKLERGDNDDGHIEIVAAASSGDGSSGLRWVLTDARERGRREEDLRGLAAALEERVAERTTELVHALAGKDEFLAMMAHELKTPITTIAGNAEVLRRRASNIDQRQREEAIADIEAEAARLQNLIDDLLVLARAEAGKEAELEPLLPDRIASRVAARCQPTFHRQIDVHLETHLPPVIGEHNYLEQVLRNLIGNAVKYSPAHTTVEVEVKRHPRGVVFRVCDRGRGIAADELERIFEPFYRSPGAARHVQGAGIGLAVCKRLIDAQHGTIWASGRDGGGTEFAFTLPVDAETV